MARTLASVLALGTFLSAQQPVWTVASTSGPSARYGHCMAYDAARGVVVLYGGNVFGTGHVDETWTWNGSSWTKRNVSGPSARRDAAMAYDRLRQKIILFGGINLVADTWEWDGTQWTQRQPAQSPAPRMLHSMAYDEARQRIVLFGGEVGSGPPFGDTWEWDGSTWIPRFTTTLPPARFAFGMAYDSARMETVMFGGSNSSLELNDTWAWNGVDWRLTVPSTRPSARSYPVLAYYARRQVTVLFSGSTSAGAGDTWYWEANDWTKVSNLGPMGRFGHAMAYDEARDAIIMFGGNYGGYIETWRMTIPGVAGQLIPFGQSCAPGVALASKIGSVPRVGTTFYAELRNVPATASRAGMLLGTSKQFIGPFPLPLALDYLGMPGCWLYQDSAWADPVSLAAGVGTWSLAIPSQPALAGAHLFVQGAILLPGANLLGVVVTNAGDIVIGT